MKSLVEDKYGDSVDFFVAVPDMVRYRIDMRKVNKKETLSEQLEKARYGLGSFFNFVMDNHSSSIVEMTEELKKFIVKLEKQFGNKGEG